MPIGSGSGQGVGSGTGLHPFDTGAKRPQRTLVRQHVIAQLADLLRANGGKGYIRAISPLPRPLRNLAGDDLQKIVNELDGRVPAILVALGDKTYGSIDLEAQQVLGALDVEVYAISSHPRSFVQGRLEQDAIATTDVTNDPGIETMLEHIEERLIGQRIGVAGALELRPQSENEIGTSPEHTMWGQRYSIHVHRDVNPGRDQTFVLKTVEVDGFPDGFDTESGKPPFTKTVTTLEVPEP